MEPERTRKDFKLHVALKRIYLKRYLKQDLLVMDGEIDRLCEVGVIHSGQDCSDNI